MSATGGMPPALPTQAASFLAAEHATAVLAGGSDSWSTLQHGSAAVSTRHWHHAVTLEIMLLLEANKKFRKHSLARPFSDIVSSNCRLKESASTRITDACMQKGCKSSGEESVRPAVARQLGTPLRLRRRALLLWTCRPSELPHSCLLLNTRSLQDPRRHSLMS